MEWTLILTQIEYITRGMEWTLILTQIEYITRGMEWTLIFYNPFDAEEKIAYALKMTYCVVPFIFITGLNTLTETFPE